MGRDVQNSECKMENSKCTFLQFTFKMSLKSHLAFPMYFRKKKSEKKPIIFLYSDIKTTNCQIPPCLEHRIINDEATIGLV